MDEKMKEEAKNLKWKMIDNVETPEELYEATGVLYKHINIAKENVAPWQTMKRYPNCIGKWISPTLQ